MRRLFWHISGRFYEARSERARKKYVHFKEVAEKFFTRLKGASE